MFGPPVFYITLNVCHIGRQLISLKLTRMVFPVGSISRHKIERLCMVKIKIPKKQTDMRIMITLQLCVWCACDVNKVVNIHMKYACRHWSRFRYLFKRE